MYIYLIILIYTINIYIYYISPSISPRNIYCKFFSNFYRSKMLKKSYRKKKGLSNPAFTGSVQKIDCTRL